jgi:hypothetical protein
MDKQAAVWATVLTGVMCVVIPLGTWWMVTHPELARIVVLGGVACGVIVTFWKFIYERHL